MKKNIIASSMLSALLFTVAALPASASPAVKSAEPNKGLNVQIMQGVAKPAINLLELVKQYAPDTLQDWKDALDKQAKHVVKLDNLSHSVTIMEPGQSLSTETKQMMSKEAISVPAGTAHQGTQHVIAMPITKSAATITMSKQDNQLFTDLNKAVEAKDAEAIKTALGKLLEQFKTQAQGQTVEQAASK